LRIQEVVPKLIPALITVEHEVVMVDPNAGANGGGYPSVNGQPGQMIGYGGRSIPILTPPAVAPGAVAYGATSVPSSGFVGGNFNIGSGGSSGPTPKLLPIQYRNDEVLKALVKLTGRDFGYDMASWKQWLTTSFQVDKPPARRVSEP
jgi:hypothetical protein